MKIDTELTRRMRNALLTLSELEPGGVFVDPEALSEEQQATLERVLPILETLYLVMIADDESTVSEREALRGALQTLTDARFGPAMVAWLVERFDRQIAEQGREARLERIGAQIAMDRDDAEGTFALAAAVALADGEVAEAETRLVVEIAKYFGISQRRANEILHGGEGEA